MRPSKRQLEQTRTNTIPRDIETQLDFIHGQLICQACRQLIGNGGERKGYTYISGLGIDPQSIHICGQVKFNYDFNSPLTIAEQYNNHIMHITKEDIKKATEEIRTFANPTESKEDKEKKREAARRARLTGKRIKAD